MKHKRALAFASTTLISLFIVGNFSLRDRMNTRVQESFCRATAEGRVGKMRLLLFAGANVHGVYGSCQPLMNAAYFGQTDAARFLINKGVDIDPEGIAEETPLAVAARFNQADTARMLLSRGADVHKTVGRTCAGTYPETALSIAANNNNIETVAVLLKYGAIADEEDGIVPLNSAVKKDRIELVKMLLASGAVPEKMAHETPLLEMASQNHDPEMVALLKEAGAKE